MTTPLKERAPERTSKPYGDPSASRALLIRTAESGNLDIHYRNVIRLLVVCAFLTQFGDHGLGIGAVLIHDLTNPLVFTLPVQAVRTK